MDIKEHYRPPASTVTDGQLLMRPRSVKRAVLMMIGVMAIGQVILFTQFSIGRLLERPQNLGFLSFFLGLIAFLWFMIWQRRKWARVIFTLLIIPGTLQGVALIVMLLGKGEMFGLVVALQQIGQISAVVLLYTKESNAWFRGEVNENE